MDREEHRRQLKELLDAEDEEIGFAAFAASLSNENNRLKYLINLRKLMGKDPSDIAFCCSIPKEELQLKRI